MGKAPAFQFYAADFLTGTALMTDQEVGQYIRLLCHQWNLGPLPPDNPSLSRLLSGGSLITAVRDKFETNEAGELFNARLESERLKQNEFREKQSENGRKGGRPKGLANPSLSSGLTQTKPKRNPSPNPNHNPKKSSSSSSSSSVLGLLSSEKDSASAEESVFPFSSDEFREAWQDFVAMRAEIRKPLRPTAIRLSLKNLEAMGEEAAILSLRESTANQWQGLFEPKLRSTAMPSGRSRDDPRGNFAAREQFLKMMGGHEHENAT